MNPSYEILLNDIRVKTNDWYERLEKAIYAKNTIAITLVAVEIANYQPPTQLNSQENDTIKSD